MINWKAIGLGFIVTLVVALIGLYVPFLSLPIAPLIGGIVAGYLVGGSYRNGIINGGLSAGIGGFIYALATVLLLGGTISASAATMGINVTSETLTAIAVVGAILAFILYFILGLIGGIIGVFLKERGAEKPMPGPAPTRKSPDIPFNKENIPKCLCPTCPVQEKSDCAKEKLMKMQEMMQNEEEMTPKPRDFPGMYCTNGKAICVDIDTSQYCICEDCAVHKLYDLDNAEPTFLYCKDGKAM
jgi:hypothetical protein